MLQPGFEPGDRPRKGREFGRYSTGAMDPSRRRREGASNTRSRTAGRRVLDSRGGCPSVRLRGASFGRVGGRDCYIGSCRFQPLPGPTPPGALGSSAPVECACLDEHPRVRYPGSTTDAGSARRRHAAVAGRGHGTGRGYSSHDPQRYPTQTMVEAPQVTPASIPTSGSNRCYGSERGEPVFPDPGRVVRTWGRVIRAKKAGLRRTWPPRDNRWDRSSSDRRPVPHVDRPLARWPAHPRLATSERVVGWCVRSSCGVTEDDRGVNASVTHHGAIVLILPRVWDT